MAANEFANDVFAGEYQHILYIWFQYLLSPQHYPSLKLCCPRSVSATALCGWRLAGGTCAAVPPSDSRTDSR
jgi:hypothetical protein